MKQRRQAPNTRRLYQMEVTEYYYEWFLHKAQIVEHQAWYDDRRTIVHMRPSMNKGNFYRLTLSDNREVVVTERHTITVERY
jgi:hypothetical protein